MKHLMAIWEAIKAAFSGGKALDIYKANDATQCCIPGAEKPRDIFDGTLAGTQSPPGSVAHREQGK